MGRGRLMLTVLAAVAALIAVAVGVGLASASPLASRPPAADPGRARGLLDDRLGQIAAESVSGGPAAGIARARRAHLPVADGRVRVVVSGAGALRAVDAAGGAVEATADGLVQALVPPAALPSVAAAAGIDSVRPPASFSEAAVSGQELATTGAAQFQSAGTGAGTTIAIVDVNFAGYTSRQAEGELPANLTVIDHCGGNLTIGDGHGTAVAEVVHEVAPGATLLLICIDTEVTLSQALDDAIARGASIVSHSVVWFNTSRGDGTGGPGSPEATVTRAKKNGIIWVSAAGNDARTHWSGVFQDTNANGRNEFAPGDEGNGMVARAGKFVCAWLKWDEWPTTSTDYDLFIENASDNTVLASSQNAQRTTAGPPVEATCWTNGAGADVVVNVVVKRMSATTSPRLDFTTNARLEYQVAAQSVSEPGSSPNVIAVGAVCSTGADVEPYSSRGPTIDGRTKPDVVGPDAVSTATFGAASSCTTGFTGTSAAAPAVAGLLALRRSAEPGLTPAALEASFLADATDLGATGKDTTTGFGLAWLPLASGSAGRIAYALPGESGADHDLVVSSPDGARPARVTGAAGDDTDPALDPSGRRIAFTRTTAADGADVYVAAADGSGPTRLTTNAGADIQPAWSPDGSRIAFASEREGDLGIWVMKADGADQTRLTTGNARSPAWSPDGASIAYSSSTPGSGYDIWVTKTDGTPPLRLTSGSFDETAPAWSATGRIAYAVNGTIHAIDAGGTNDTLLVAANSTGAAGDPAWSPDGSSLAFVRGTTLWRSSATGAGQAQLTPPAGAGAPTWSIVPAPPPAPSGGGGGGSSGGTPDVVLTQTADRTTAAVGDTIVLRLQARLATQTPATRVVVTETLPANVELLSSRADRGSGCTGARTLVCDLDFLSGSLVASVEVVIRVTGPGEVVATATAGVVPADADPSNNVATVRVQPPAAVLPPPRTPTASRGVRRSGTARADVLRGTRFADVLRGLGGADRLFGLGGADRLFGGPGKDTLDGGDGNDTITARDGERDVVRCGRGRDVVVADRLDRVAGDCETVHRPR